MIIHTTLLRVLACSLLIFSAGAQAGAREIGVATLRTAGTPGSLEARAISELNDALVREICQRIAARCRPQPLRFDEIIPGVESGRFQLGVGNVLRTPEREARVLFSQMLWRSSSRLVGTPASIKKFGGSVRLSELQGATLVVETGTQQHRYLLGIAESQKLKVIDAASAGDAMTLLLKGRADFSLMPVRSAYFLLQDARGAATFVGPALVEHGLGGSVHAILPKNEEALRQEVDAALEAMRADGTFQRILRRHMPILAD